MLEKVLKTIRKGKVLVLLQNLSRGSLERWPSIPSLPEPPLCSSSAIESRILCSFFLGANRGLEELVKESLRPSGI